MKRWEMYSKDGKSIVAIKCGFNWFAFFFRGIWALFYRLPVATVVGIVLPFVFLVLAGSTFPLFYIFSDLLLAIAYGFYGNKWKAAKLIKTGWTLDKIVRAKTASEAIAEYNKEKTHL